MDVSRHSMKSVLVILLLFLLEDKLLAQKGIQYSKDSDTVFWYGDKNTTVKRFKLGLIENDMIDYSFRFWSLGLVIKITGEAGKSTGEIVRFVEVYPNDKSTRAFTKHYPISEQKAFQIRHLVDSLQIESLPSDKDIKGWEQGLDGLTYFTEYKKRGLYTFKKYWTPTSQGALKEAAQFQNFVSGLDEILDLSNNSKVFQDAIPFASWHYPGSSSTALKVKPYRRKRKKNGG